MIPILLFYQKLWIFSLLAGKMTICHLFTVFACFWHSEYSTSIVRVVDSTRLTKRQGTTEEPGSYCFCVVLNLPSTSRVSWFPINCIGCSVTEDFETGFTPFRKKPCDWTLLFARKLPFKMLELQSYFMTALLLLISFLLLHHFYPYCFILEAYLWRSWFVDYTNQFH